MSIFYVSIVPPRNSQVYHELKTHYNKVGIKWGYYSWFVRERDMKKRKLETLGDRVVTSPTSSDTTMSVLKKRQRGG